MKYALSIISIAIILLSLIIGYWIPRSLTDGETTNIVTEIIENRNSICDYNADTGFIVPLKSKIFLTGVTKVKWQVVERGDLDKFMDDNGLDFVYYGQVKIRNDGKTKYIDISNWPVASKRFKGMFLSGGTSSYSVRARFPSLLNIFFGSFDIVDGVRIVG